MVAAGAPTTIERRRPPIGANRGAMTALSGWRVRLRPGIVAVFLLVMLPLSSAMIAVLYRQNSQLAISFAADAMKRASNDTVISVQGLLDPIAQTVNLSTAFGQDQRMLLR